MERLYIIGNGFDRHHGLPTRYSDFHKHILNHNTEVENIFEEYFNFRADGDRLWTHLEEDLATFDYRSFFSTHCDIDIMDESFRRSETDSLYDAIKQESEELITNIMEAFVEWIDSIDISPCNKTLDLDNQAMFINFNYTRTLQEIYQIPQAQVFQIHGEIENGYGDLVLGHNKVLKKESELDENGDSKRTMFSDSEAAARLPFYQFTKPVKDLIKQYKQLFESITNTKNIYVLGHSLNKIDLPYFKAIVKRSPLAKWHVSYYGEGEKETHAAKLRRLKIPDSAIRLFEL